MAAAQSLFDMLVDAQPAQAAQLRQGGILSSPDQLQTVHPLTGESIAVFLVRDWAVLTSCHHAPGGVLRDPGFDWSVQPGLYPLFEARYHAVHPVYQASLAVKGEKWYLLGRMIPLTKAHVGLQEGEASAWTDVDYLWTPSYREDAWRRSALAVAPTTMVFTDYQRAHRRIVVAGRPFDDEWTRAIQYLLVFYPDYALMLHTPHVMYKDHLEGWVANRGHDLREDDARIEVVPYSGPLRRMRWNREDPVPHIPVHLGIFGLADHEADVELEQCLGTQLALRGHLDLREVRWEDFGPPYPRLEDVRVWNAEEIRVAVWNLLPED